MKHLIINADDFGLHEAVNAAIARGHSEGIISSATLMAGAGAFLDAVAIAKRLPRLSVGVHLTLVGERPVAAPRQVASLLEKDGLFSKQYPQFLSRYLRGLVSKSEIRLELTAQIEKVLQQGLAISHLDSHQHLHVFPGILEIVLELAETYRIPALRIPREPYFFSGGYPCGLGRWAGRCGLSFLAGLARDKARTRKMAMPDNFFGMLAGGNLQEQYLCKILTALPQGCSEIMLHPGTNSAALQAVFGWPYAWEKELAAVCSPNIRTLLEQEQITLISYADLNKKGTI